jgi:hypothetical protein
MINVLLLDSHKKAKKRSIVINNLPPDTTEKTIFNTFSKFGRIIGCSVQDSALDKPPMAHVNFEAEEMVG